MFTCPTCQLPFDGGAQFCPRDGTPLIESEPGDPLRGRLLGGRYRLIDRLGQGGMGTVYRALHTLMEKPVAVKVLRADLAGDADAVARFHREARSASRIDHEHCIRVTDFGQSDDGLLFLVMELLEGEALSGLIARGPVPAARAAAIGEAVALGLHHAHEQGVVHRDLKPDNVFLARRGRRETVKVLDFGLAKIASERVGGAAITKAGVVFGTPEYMAPEQAEGGVIDARTDVYALGVLLYHLVTGTLPFEANSFLALLAKQIEEEPEPPRARCPELAIPEELEQIILRCMAKPPDARFQSAGEVADALAPFAESARPGGAAETTNSMRTSIETPAAGSGRRPIASSSSTSTPAAALAGTPPQAPVAPTSLPPAAADALAALEAPAAPSALATPEAPGFGDEIERPARRPRRQVALIAAGVLAALAGGLWLARRGAIVTPPPPEIGVAEAPLAAARRLLAAGDLDGAARQLAPLRVAGDGVELQALLGEVALRRGNRLRALAHYHRATQLAPDDAEAHARLAALLAQLGQRDAACASVNRALRLQPELPLARATHAAAHCATKGGQ